MDHTQGTWGEKFAAFAFFNLKLCWSSLYYYSFNKSIISYPYIYPAIPIPYHTITYKNKSNNNNITNIENKNKNEKQKQLTRRPRKRINTEHFT